METTYRLEFNEKQQLFNLDNRNHKENTYGWFTIFEYCSTDEFIIYKAYVNRLKKEKLTKKYLLKCAVEVKKMMTELVEQGFTFQIS